MVTQTLGADFEFTAFGINDAEEFNPIAGLGMENRGMVYIIKSIDYEFEYIEGLTWEPNVWYNIRIEVSGDEIQYYFDDELIYTGPNFTQLNISGFNMLHNNYGGSAYYDNIQINGDFMGVNELQKGSVKIYPNPVRDFVNVEVPVNEEVKTAAIYSLSGQVVLNAVSAKTLNVSQLANGVYVLKLTTETGKVYTEKFIKQ